LFGIHQESSLFVIKKSDRIFDNQMFTGGEFEKHRSLWFINQSPSCFRRNY